MEPRCSWPTKSPPDMQPIYMLSMRSTPASSRASIAASVKMVRRDCSHSSPHLRIPSPITATSLMISSSLLADLAPIFHIGAVINIGFVLLELGPSLRCQISDLLDARGDLKDEPVATGARTVGDHQDLI